MNVGQLIAHLQQFPPDLDVVVDGYEDGYDNPELSETDVVWNHNVGPDGRKETWYDGRHDRIDSHPDKEPHHVLVIGRWYASE